MCACVVVVCLVTFCVTLCCSVMYCANLCSVLCFGVMWLTLTFCMRLVLYCVILMALWCHVEHLTPPRVLLVFYNLQHSLVVGSLCGLVFCRGLLHYICISTVLCCINVVMMVCGST